MKTKIIGIFLVLLSSALLWGKVTIKFTQPNDGQTVNTTSPTVKADISKTSGENWESVQFKLNTKDWTNFDISGKEADSTIQFEHTFNSLQDDKEHTIYLKAILKNKADSAEAQLKFTVSLPPEITQSSVTPKKISPYNNKLTLSLTFNKAMDSNVSPVFYFTIDNSHIDTLRNTGNWVSDTTFRLESTKIVENNGLTGTVKITVAEAENVFGVRMKKQELEKTFEIDTKKPDIVRMEFSPNRPINTVSAGQLSVSIHFNEPMDTTVTPTVILENGSAQAEFARNGKWQADSIYYVENSNALGADFPDGQKATVKVSAGKDAGGNAMDINDKYKAFLFDHSTPQITSLVSSDRAVHIQNTGEVTLTFRFNENMNQGIKPIIKIKSGTKEAVFDTNGTWLDNRTFQAKNQNKIDASFAGHGMEVFAVIENAQDLAGNALNTTTEAAVFLMDHKPPQLLSVESNRLYVNDQTFSTVKLTLKFDEVAEPLNDLIIKVQDSIKVSFKEPTNKGKNLVYSSNETLKEDIQDGALKFTFAVFQDTLGNRSVDSSTVSFESVLILDNAPPAKPTIQSHARSTRGQKFVFHGTKSDNNNHVGIFINNALRIETTDTTLNWSYEYDISSLDDGGQPEGQIHLFKIFAQDAAGNKSQEVKDSLVIDRTAPQEAEIDPDPFATEYINKNSVTFGLKNTSGEKARFVFRESGLDYDIPVDMNRFFNKGQNKSGLVKTFLPNVDGERELKLFGIDTLGNRSTTPIKTWRFTVDRVAPRINAVLVNGQNTSGDAVVFVGPSEVEQLKLKFLFIEETSGMNRSIFPQVLLKDNSGHTIPFQAQGSWDGEEYTVSSAKNIPVNYQHDGLYAIHLINAMDKANNTGLDTTNFKLYIDTHAPQKPSITNYSGNEVVTNQNIITLMGTKPTNEFTRILLMENGTRLDSTSWNSDKKWEINFLATESREYNFEIISQDMAGNKSKIVPMRFIIDWLPPVLSIKSPLLQVEASGNKQTGRLSLFFSENIYSILKPAAELYIYLPENPQTQMPAIDLLKKQNELLAEFSDTDSARLGQWLSEGKSPRVYLPEGLLTDIAGNANKEVPKVAFSIISPSIIESIPYAETYFSPNGDGIKDSLMLDIQFTNSSDKYLDISVYDPFYYGTVLSLVHQRISMDALPILVADSTCLIKKIGTNKVRIYWNGYNSFTGKPVPEGSYNLKVYASVNPNFAFQLPLLRKVQIDTSGPFIRKIFPAIGQKGTLKLTHNTKLKLYPSDSIFINILDENNELKTIQYLKSKVEFGTLSDSTFIPIANLTRKMMPDTINSENAFVFEMDSIFYKRLKLDSTINGLRFSLTDSAHSNVSTYAVYLRFETSKSSELKELVNFPNPFNPEKEQTTFQFSTGSNQSQAELRIFDVSGELVYIKTFSSGTESGDYIQIQWDGTSIHGNKLANGVYFALVTSGDKKSNVAKILIFRK